MCVCVCAWKRLGVHAPLSTQMVFASDAVFSFNLQSFITYTTYCKPSTHTLPVGSFSAPLMVQPNTVASCSGMTLSSLTLPSGCKWWLCLNGGMLSRHCHSITTSSLLSLSLLLIYTDSGSLSCVVCCLDFFLYFSVWFSLNLSD